LELIFYLIFKLGKIKKYILIFTGLAFHQKKRPNLPKVKKYVPPAARKMVSVLEGDDLMTPRVMFFDLETTGLFYNTHEIIQISAKSDEKQFNLFVMPSAKTISSAATKLTGISKVKRGNRYQLLHKKRPVFSHQLHEALKEFVEFLESFPEKILLVAHNAPFDLRFLLKVLLLRKQLLDRFSNKVCGFVDTLPAARAMCPMSREGPINHKLGTLLEYYYGQMEVELHNAEVDVLALEEVYKCLSGSIADFKRYSFNMDEFIFFRKVVKEAKGTCNFYF